MRLFNKIISFYNTLYTNETYAKFISRLGICIHEIKIVNHLNKLRYRSGPFRRLKVHF